MYRFILATALSISCFSANATAVDHALAVKFLEETKVEEVIQSTIDEYVSQLGKGAAPQQQGKLRQMLETTMGWNATKDQLVELVKQMYTQEEVDAYLAYVHTPAGASMTAKSAEFSRRMTGVASDKLKKLIQQDLGQ